MKRFTEEFKIVNKSVSRSNSKIVPVNDSAALTNSFEADKTNESFVQDLRPKAPIYIKFIGIFWCLVLIACAAWILYVSLKTINDMYGREAYFGTLQREL